VPCLRDYQNPALGGQLGASVPGRSADAVALLAVVAAVVPAARAYPSACSPVTARPHDEHAAHPCVTPSPASTTTAEKECTFIKGVVKLLPRKEKVGNIVLATSQSKYKEETKRGRQNTSYL